MWTASRNTKETHVTVELITKPGDINVDTRAPFLDHMLDTVLVTAGWSGKIIAKSDIDPDGHHTAEDVGIVLGQAIHSGLSKLDGYARYGCSYVPMDESLARAVIDIGGRTSFVWQLPESPLQCNGWSWDWISELWAGFARGSRATVHIRGLYGGSAHHLAEAICKAMALSLDQACRPRDAVPSTKGVL